MPFEPTEAAGSVGRRHRQIPPRSFDDSRNKLWIVVMKPAEECIRMQGNKAEPVKYAAREMPQIEGYDGLRTRLYCGCQDMAIIWIRQ
ncbi:MAG: hypothetical protein WDN69_14195 [Aliidongia sp.]